MVADAGLQTISSWHWQMSARDTLSSLTWRLSTALCHGGLLKLISRARGMSDSRIRQGNALCTAQYNPPFFQFTAPFNVLSCLLFYCIFFMSELMSFSMQIICFQVCGVHLLCLWKTGVIFSKPASGSRECFQNIRQCSVKIMKRVAFFQ